MSDPRERVRRCLSSLDNYTRMGTGFVLRPYQLDAGHAILDSIRKGMGLSFVLMLPRQSGKDELVTQLIAYLMRRLSLPSQSRQGWSEGSIIVVNPTYKPQTINAILRLESRLSTHPLTRGRWRKRSHFMRQVGTCRTSFLSGDGQANVVGATAAPLLVVNEAQDISAAVYDRNFAPMCASSNATRLFCGTAWTSTTLLARELRRARHEQQADGLQRLFIADADQVGQLHPPYARYVQGEITRLGRQHPLIRTQYFNEEIDAQAGMFPPARQLLMHGQHAARNQPEPGEMTAFLLDVGGQDEGLRNMEALENPSRDHTSLKIVALDFASLADLGKPTYRVMHRRSWLGEKHTTIHAQLRRLADVWQPRWVVVDASGVGEGLFSMLDLSLPGRCIPVRFSQSGKSEIGYQFLSIVETGRYQEYAPFDLDFQRQLEHCQSEILPGPARHMRWGVPDGLRDADGRTVHDDDLMTSALTAILDRLEWSLHSETLISSGLDDLESMDGNY